ncbi:methyltransferase domain-containing protein [Candidatus Bathyarchaeota archaeon]|nr:methyltransferase domain-containing protein [Candidatus Bathyarchaeota archaeon]
MEPLNLIEKFSGLKIGNLEVLDVGCGFENSPLSVHITELPFKKLTAIDVAAPCIKHVIANRKNIAAKELQVYVRDARNYLPTLPDDSQDVVIMMDILEHFTHEEGAEAIKHAKRIARKRVLIWLPVGNCDQKGTLDNPAMEHKSTWMPEDLEALGFSVTTWKAFHQHVAPPADAAWAIWNRVVIKSILVERFDVHGDVLVATSVLPGLKEKYPHAKIDWHVRTGFDFALQNNPYIRTIIQGPVSDIIELHSKYDIVIPIEHHNKWSKPMAWVHCDEAGVPVHRPELYLTLAELRAVPERLRQRVLVANKAGWKSRECPNLTQVLNDIATDEYLQIDSASPISSHIEQFHGTLREVAAVMKFAKLYIGIDTVFMHMAVALYIPMVLFLGPTGPESQWIPDSVFLRPFVHLNPAEPNLAFANGIQLSKEDILNTIRKVLKENGEIKPIEQEI